MLDDIANKKTTAAELFNLYFVPIVNIDGYDISYTTPSPPPASTSHMQTAYWFVVPEGSPGHTLADSLPITWLLTGKRVFTRAFWGFYACYEKWGNYSCFLTNNFMEWEDLRV
ncbi:hypothetical protein H257_17278 [Aphanomyces astaci]|uniref:Peptidase M14 carboxypeptidase A domain-containing protein n=1 Tax=Aphanomyces astaci TaxID=112090 RepID=W4FHD9_APHAT|nr:hypothetical protein H257_17278 [Aphanomyces astaci]ETV66236.1 hypothetical protein H257_17278 [Aphanomyces astaci]|eukprot:XP_009844305.1 hypothetical protein H257_17278 [Aphanomyces astaci]